jgi:hypothetical protein
MIQGLRCRIQNLVFSVMGFKDLGFEVLGYRIRSIEYKIY